MKQFHYWGALVLCLMLNGVYSQAPQSFKYQSVARNSEGEPIVNGNIGLRISIRDQSATGTIVYQETHVVTTNSFGLFSISVGEGTSVSSTFSTISWGSGSKFLEVEADFAGGSNYTSLGASQLLSVPYALYAASGTQGPQGLIGPQGPAGVQGLTGSNGTNGSNGLNILNGTTNPPAGVGVNGEFYINTITSTLFGPRTSGAWPAGVSLIGPMGATGSTGANGLNILNGANNPTSGIGLNGEFYINTTTSTLFGPKTGAGWPTGVSLIGPPGSAINAWSLTGNAGTVDGTNFIGTTDNIPLNFKVNNIKAGRIDAITGNTFNTFLGLYSGQFTTGSNNTGIGNAALSSNTTGTNNTGIGLGSIISNTTGSFNTASGSSSLTYNKTGSDNVALGYGALNKNVSGSAATAIGAKAMFYSNDTNSPFINDNVAVGYEALMGSINPSNNTGTRNVSLGYQTLKSNTTGNNNVAAGYITLTSNSTGFNNTALGGASMVNNTTGSSNTAVGWSSLWANTIGFFNTAIGQNAMNNNIDGSHNTAIGWSALSSNTNSSGSFNVALGSQSLYSNTTGTYNSASGYESMFVNTTGSFNSANGGQSLFSNSIGSHNSADGVNALYSNSSGSRNTANGYSALSANTTGQQNTALGYQAGYTSVPANANTTGSSNTFIGYNSGPGSATQLINATAIGYEALVTSSNSLVLGGTGVNAVNVGIGTTAPTAKLHVAGSVKIVDGTQGAGKVLTSDGTGLASWITPISGGSGWGLTGNAGTLDGTNFIGTTDNQALVFKVNNQKAGRIDPPNGNVFLGYQAGNSNTSIANVAIGTQSLYTNTTGNQLTAIGFNSLYFNTTGIANTAVGNLAQYSNTTGNYNTADGYLSLYSNTSGYANTSIGAASLYDNTTGHHNSAVGYYALHDNLVGTYNSAMGNNCLQANSSGNYNTGFGATSMQSNTLGNGNSASGYGALASNTTGSNNTALGYQAFFSGTSYSNSTAIGYNAQVTASNMIRLGDGNVTSINGAVSFTVVSDGRFKKDIKEAVSGLPFIMKLRPVTYHLDMDMMAGFMKTPDSLRNKESEQAKARVLQTGFIAQEVEQSAKELGYDFSGVDKPQGENGYYGLRYAEFTVPLVKAVQEQQTTIEALKAEIEKLKTENNTLKESFENRLKNLEAALGTSSKK